MFGLGKTLTFIIGILGWLKSDLEVVLLYFGFDWQISGEKEETAHFWQIRRSMPRSDLEVVLLYFGFDWQISGEKEETAHFWKI